MKTYIERERQSEREGKREREREPVSICRERVRRHAFWQEL